MMVVTKKVHPVNMVTSIVSKGFVADIFKSYFDLKGSFWDQKEKCTSEARLLAYAFLISFVLFLERLPNKVTDRDIFSSTGLLFDYIGMDLFASIFFGPIFLYSLSALTHLVSVPFKGKASFFEARLAFFWAIIVAAPLLLIVAVIQVLVPGVLFSQVFQCIAMVIYAWIFSTIFCSAERFASNKPLFFLLSFGYLYLSYVVT